MAELRVHNCAISLDGYDTRPGPGLDHPLGVGGERLHGWMFETRFWGEGGGGAEVDDLHVAAVPTP